MSVNTYSKQLPKISDQNLLSQGWQVLVERLGYTRAQRFLLQIPKPTGDSVKEIRKFRKQYKTIEQLHQEILNAKKAGEI